MMDMNNIKPKDRSERVYSINIFNINRLQTEIEII